MPIVAHLTSRASTSAGTRCTIQRGNGSFCDGEGWPDAPFPICRHHAVKLYIEMRGIHAGALRREIDMLPPLNPIATLTPSNLERDSAKHKAKLAERSVVYYVRIGDAIKIGFTSDLTARMSQIRVDRANVLAAEPGGRELEAKRHEQFSEIRIGQREDFKPTLALIRHIEAVREFHGDPVFRNGRGKIIAT